MRIAQKSAIVFTSKLIGSIFGFIATIYFARILGAEVLGYYAQVLAIVSWLSLGATAGISSAVIKRISEGTERSAYFTAGVVLISLLGVVISVVAFAFRDTINGYIGVKATKFVIAIFLSSLFYKGIGMVLTGEQRPHLSSILSSGQIATRSIFQVLLVLLGGLGLTGMFLGYATSGILIGLIGLSFISSTVTTAKRQHFRSLFAFAKFSWMGSLQARVFNNIDILILGAFVPSSLVGIYSVTWNIGSIMKIFSDSITTTLFPELSQADEEQDTELVSNLVTKSLKYNGLIGIPGFFGSLVLSDELLQIYGAEFVKGTIVLNVLILALLIHSYQQQFVNGLNAIDRPDKAFRINLIYIVANATLNIGLIVWIGWLGAAVASGLAATVALIFSFQSLRRSIAFKLPISEFLRQLVASLVMVAVVFGIEAFADGSIFGHDVAHTVVLTLLGVVVYFSLLLLISRDFRTLLLENIGDSLI